LTLNGTGTLSDGNGTKQDLGSVVIGGSATTRTLTSAVKLTSLTIGVDNTFVLAGNDLSFSAPAAVSNNGTLRLQGAEILTNVTNLDLDSGTVAYIGDGPGGLASFTLKDFGPTDYFNLKINSAAGDETFLSQAAKTIPGSLTVSAGTYDANAQTTQVTGLTTINGGTHLASTAPQSFTGGFLLISGTFVGPVATTAGATSPGIASLETTSPSGTTTSGLKFLDVHKVAHMSVLPPMFGVPMMIGLPSGGVVPILVGGHPMGGLMALPALGSQARITHPVPSIPSPPGEFTAATAAVQFPPVVEREHFSEVQGAATFPAPAAQGLFSGVDGTATIPQTPSDSFRGVQGIAEMPAAIVHGLTGTTGTAPISPAVEHKRFMGLQGSVTLPAPAAPGTFRGVEGAATMLWAPADGFSAARGATQFSPAVGREWFRGAQGIFIPPASSIQIGLGSVPAAAQPPAPSGDKAFDGVSGKSFMDSELDVSGKDDERTSQSPAPADRR